MRDNMWVGTWQFNPFFVDMSQFIVNVLMICAAIKFLVGK